MAAATPVLERRISTLERKTNIPESPAEIEHNSRIRDNYARLTDPTISADELMGRETKKDDSSEQKFNQSEYYKANPREALFGKRPETNLANTPTITAEPIIETPYLVTNARADADIFRADSPVNQRYFAEQQTVTNSVESEEENEDLRPTRTTIQYGSSERINEEVIPSSTVKDAAVNEAHATFGKREKIIIGTFISMVVALFVLVIINSAIISHLNSSVSQAEQELAAKQSEYAQIAESVEEAKSAESVYEYALNNGMVFVETED